jgi:hypothetical protein
MVITINNAIYYRLHLGLHIEPDPILHLVWSKRAARPHDPPCVSEINGHKVMLPFGCQTVKLMGTLGQRPAMPRTM